MQASTASTTFIWRRVHSLMGFWLVIYLFYHLLVNSQAALWISDDGSTFIRMVNTLESLPYLHVVESLLIGVPLAVHFVWGVKRALTAKTNVSTLKYERNWAYSIQRWTSWILVFGIAGHVLQMRFLEQPKTAEGISSVIVAMDDQLLPLAQKIGATLTPMEDGQVLASTPTPGGAYLLMVRNTFKSPLMVASYCLFVLAAAFHAFNGFWTFLITWGVILSYRSQKALIPFCMLGALLLVFFGFAAIWGSYAN
jgi:succinate dehydrogenase / fumarate reductase cytochrome b subunit